MIEPTTVSMDERRFQDCDLDKVSADRMRQNKSRSMGMQQ